MSDNQDTPGKDRPHRAGRKLIGLAAATAIAVGGVVGVQAFADNNAYQHLQLNAHYGGGSHGDDHKGFADMTDVEIEAQVERVVKHLAIEIDATPEQQQAITAIVTAAARDLKPVRDRMRATGRELHALLLADTIDRAALEGLRAERLADAERISKNLVGALADVAEVLSPAQRKVLDERIGQFRAMRGGWHRG
jgi:Spy/CpxP family protein refolding chaperone